MTANAALRIYGGPHRYIQGPDALDYLGKAAAPFGKTPVVVADAFILDRIGARIEAILDAAGLQPVIRAFEGEITYPAIEALNASLNGVLPDVAIGIGGGKSLDAAKGLAKQIGIDVITVPTIASNDSPTSASIAMYDDHHVMISVDRLNRSPEAVIVDTKLIATAPVRFLRAGIGDAISKKFEADGCYAGTGITPFGTRPLITAITVADACYRTIREHGAEALASVERQQVTPALEATVEATVLMSGLGFENGGLSLAHSLTRGLVKARDARNAIHGEHVAWGLLVQLAAENRSDDDIRDIMDFYDEISMPRTLAGLGMKNATADEIQDIARWTMTAPHLANLAVPVDAAAIVVAIDRIERMA